MISPISGGIAYSPYAIYGGGLANRSAQQAQNLDRAQTQGAQRSGMVLTARKVAQPDTPVQPVTPARPISADEDPAQAGLLRFGSDPTEMAVRMRIRYPNDQANAAQAANAQKAQNPLPGMKPALGDDSARQVENPVLGESKSAAEVMEEGECQTCKERKYQDGSDDPGVSYKTPTNIAPDQAASAVLSHENEHVVREQAAAKREGRKVVSQSVTMHTDICPECGKVYVSGGETRTVTKADNSQQTDLQQEQKNGQDSRVPYSAVA